MSNQYAGGFISKTPPAVTTSSAQGMWTLSQQAQYQKDGVWPLNPNVPSGGIGSAFGGGYYAGKIAVDGGGVATHYLVVAPKATGENSSRTWGVYGVMTSATSLIDGPANTAILNALGSSYQAAQYCVGLNAGAGLNGYTDWYLPAKNELEVCYYNLKPTTDANNTSSGSNANAVSPEPVSQNYTSGSPAQTSVAIFQDGGSQAFNSNTQYYWTSTDNAAFYANYQYLKDGQQNRFPKLNSIYVRAVRRVPI
jgi:hypothetical protein